MAFKDQSPKRPIDYGTRPRRKLSYRMATAAWGLPFSSVYAHGADQDLPVQIHTGTWLVSVMYCQNQAIGLTRLLELHRETRFDLFHANWPYSGEILYLGKNYPNVPSISAGQIWSTRYTADQCSSRRFQCATCQDHGYGSDFGSEALAQAWAHADLARDNIAAALSDLVEMEYLGWRRRRNCPGLAV